MDRPPSAPRRIGLIAPPWIPVPPPAYGGIEAVVAGLGRVLVQRGHEVTLVAAAGSHVPGAEIIVPRSIPDGTPLGEPLTEWEHVLEGYAALAEVDAIIDHTGPAGALLAGLSEVPTLHVCHNRIDDTRGRVYEGIARRVPRLRLVAISQAQRRTAPRLRFTAVCPNGIDVDAVPYGTGGEALTFLGRMAPEKAPDLAIRIARRAGLPIRLAAKCRDPQERAYFEQRVRPLLGPGVEWLGEITALERGQLLAESRALVFPIDWPEPFGMVLIEAMAAGTPVLTRPHGAVPEIVRHGVTGFVDDDEVALAEAAERIGELDRRACREHVERHFSLEATADGYQAALAQICEPTDAPLTLVG